MLANDQLDLDFNIVQISTSAAVACGQQRGQEAAQKRGGGAYPKNFAPCYERKEQGAEGRPHLRAFKGCRDR